MTWNKNNNKDDNNKDNIYKNIDVTGIGNAIVDVIADVDDDFLKNNGFVKGSMTLINEEIAERLYCNIKVKEEISGGSAANTIAGLASLGNKVAFIGKVKDDLLGNSFDRGLSCLGVKCVMKKQIECQPTARCIILVTPDGQRTMFTFLGVAGDLSIEDIDENLIKQSKVAYLEGYLWDRDSAKLAIKHTIELSKYYKGKVVFSLSDSFCVERHRDDFINLLEKNIEIVFANEYEIISLFKAKSFKEAVNECKNINAIFALTRAGKGSVVVANDEVIEIKIKKIKKPLDTTGAGDLYASGFLHGYLAGKDLKTCGIMGSISASEIICHYGARPKTSIKELFKNNNIY